MAKKKSNRRYSYAFLTMGGRRWVELTPERFSRLYEKEQENIIRTAKYTREDLRIMTKRDWEAMTKDTGELGGRLYQRLADIARGKVAAEAEDIVITNYTLGLKSGANKSVATAFEALARTLKDNDRKAFDTFLTEIPDLYLFYKDKEQSHKKRQETFSKTVAEDQVEQMQDMLHRYLYDISNDYKQGKSNLYQDFKNEFMKLDKKEADKFFELYEKNTNDDDLPF